MSQTLAGCHGAGRATGCCRWFSSLRHRSTFCSGRYACRPSGFDGQFGRHAGRSGAFHGRAECSRHVPAVHDRGWHCTRTGRLLRRIRRRAEGTAVHLRHRLRTCRPSPARGFPDRLPIRRSLHTKFRLTMPMIRKNSRHGETIDVISSARTPSLQPGRAGRRYRSVLACRTLYPAGNIQLSRDHLNGQRHGIPSLAGPACLGTATPA